MKPVERNHKCEHTLPFTSSDDLYLIRGLSGLLLSGTLTTQGLLVTSRRLSRNRRPKAAGDLRKLLTRRDLGRATLCFSGELYPGRD